MAGNCMQISAGDLEFEWISDWAEMPSADSVARGWAHHGAAFSTEGQIVTFHPTESLVVILTTAGEIVRSFKVSVIEAHGLTLATNGYIQSIWLADNGRKRDPDFPLVTKKHPKNVARRYVSAQMGHSALVKQCRLCTVNRSVN